MVVIESPEDDLDTVMCEGLVASVAAAWSQRESHPFTLQTVGTSPASNDAWTAKSENDGSAAAPDGHRALSTCAQ